MEAINLATDELKHIENRSTAEDALFKSLMNAKHDGHISSEINRHDTLVSKQDCIMREMKRPFLFTLAVIISSLILLAFANLIHNKWYYLEIIPILLIIFTNVLALWENKKYIFKILEKY
jgi:hypothetical protein